MADWFAVGVGLASAAEPAEVADLVEQTLRAAGIPRDRVRLVATVDTRADHPALAPLAGLGWPLVSFPASTLAEASDPASGRPAVAEPAALLAAGPGATLVVPKRRSSRATVAVAVAAPGVPAPEVVVYTTTSGARTS